MRAAALALKSRLPTTRASKAVTRVASNDVEPVRAPSPFLALAEVPRAIVERASLPRTIQLVASAPRGRGAPVLVLPGFTTTDASTAALRAFLADLGHDVHAWELGRNLGPRAIGAEGEKLFERLHSIARDTGAKVSIVGWSLGGIMARLVAHRLPDSVRQVITFGSPFAGDPRATNAWRAYQLLSGQKFAHADTRAQLAVIAAPTPVPSTSIYSREDGVVAWQNCVEASDGATECIEVRGSHLGLTVNPAVYYAIADRLAQPEGEWSPFTCAGIAGVEYPALRSA